MSILKDWLTWIIVGEVVAIVGGVAVYVAAMTRQ
jgi:hypothetical protein